jgi:hypothetical protein
MFVSCVSMLCCPVVGRGLCDGLVTRPEESYRMCQLYVIKKPEWLRKTSVVRKSPKKKNRCLVFPHEITILLCALLTLLSRLMLHGRFWAFNCISFQFTTKIRLCVNFQRFRNMKIRYFKVEICAVL